MGFIRELSIFLTGYVAIGATASLYIWAMNNGLSSPVVPGRNGSTEDKAKAGKTPSKNISRGRGKDVGAQGRLIGEYLRRSRMHYPKT